MTTRKQPERFDDGTLVRSDFRDGARPGSGVGSDRKTAQLCTQVQRAVDFALHGSCEDPLFDDLEVVSVTPTPDAGRLTVHLQLGPGEPAGSLAELGARLERARGRVVHEVASSIRRRRAPELVFDLRVAD